MEFKVGDRVKCVKVLADSKNALEQEGTVIEVYNTNYAIREECGKKIYVKFERIGYWEIGANALELVGTLSDEEMFWRRARRE